MYSRAWAPPHWLCSVRGNGHTQPSRPGVKLQCWCKREKAGVPVLDSRLLWTVDTGTAFSKLLKANLIRTADCILKLLSRQNKGNSEESTAIKKYSGPWWSNYGVLCISFLNQGTTIEWKAWQNKCFCSMEVIVLSRKPYFFRPQAVIYQGPPRF